ncbi:protein MraZ [Megasphaera cerevisiae DSM 20462]|jgi:MraZ protein|uniref:Transcriptional regulator MraZ n=1 Tax=Megasphaera cerevisiae DSM 20462 TaxID=1122219 RepID=A0A0J6ZM06_9FIRM|nr:division/cell wall cluster transcriptional repressor MraZ [Megasphaera cerevisiae]KMO85921.1 protein MraZ [Megasphaera cerevisiae DSM 20462]MCI1750662.1 division/cell wall cluster transcriptional repressor MraZ [Megasphaera cerevisiae]OKY54446.1 cell division/cell wall cluster transcriptional repressor MraZ [Megasphaera cerevisiae]SKA08488.1 MraZ protein [Megasphaera cerevisiae DSM 20462]
MFMGEYSHTIDVKGRVILPAKFRDELGMNFVVTRGLEGCLSVYTMDSWLHLADAMKKLKASKENVRAFKRFVFGSAAEVEFDKQGRILIPGTLREYAHLEKEVTVLGTGDKIEIWNKDAYETYAAKIVPDMEEIAESMDETLDLEF